MDKEVMFKRLVENALDFLSKSISDFSEYPKYSMINFYASVELFVKARLMAEHWTLVVAKRQEPDWNKFIRGDFQSVSLDDASNRLTKIIQSGLSQKEIGMFREVAKHRNKMVHFFHDAHSGEKSSELKQEIAKTQLTAWYFLHRLITEKWKETFEPWAEEIVKVDLALRKLHEFLSVIFENVGDEISKLKELGFVFKECPSCGFKAQKHDKEKGIIYDSECMVCGLTENSLRIECPDCEATVYFIDDGVSLCEKCERHFKPKDLADILIDGGGAYIAAKDGDDTSYVGNCSECEGYHTVVLTENGQYICANCLTEFDSLQCCQWCNEGNTRDMEDSYAFGCNYCEGSIGWHRDD